MPLVTSPKLIILLAIAAASLVSFNRSCAQSAAESKHDAGKMERSVWINLSLAAPRRGYWGPAYPQPAPPTALEIERAVQSLIRQANPNRLYLIHHREFKPAQARELFRAWRRACPSMIEIVPTLVLKMYDGPKTPVFAADELEQLLDFFKKEIHPRLIGVYDILPKRDMQEEMKPITERYGSGLIRVGLQPGERLGAEWTGAVEDTWSGFCHGWSDADWQSPGFGRDTLRKWIDERNAGGKPIAFDLIVVAWDYSTTRRGEYPGYDDASKNMPLPAGRNLLAAGEILSRSRPGVLAGFSMDLLIVELNSQAAGHDGSESFYRCLKEGGDYQGYYAAPWKEACGIFRSLGEEKRPR